MSYPLLRLRHKQGSAEPVTEVNIIPVIDISLVLLVILFVTAPLLSYPNLAVELPKAASGSKPPEGPLSIVIEKDGRMLADGAQVTETELAGIAKLRKAVGGEVNALISADLAAQHGRVVRVMDLLRREGITRFGIAVTEEELSKK